jgi:hypothetical protein
MAYVVSMNWKGVTADEYDRVCEAGHLMSEPADGGIAHLATVDDEGLRVIDVWESPEKFQEFVASRLMPAVAEARLDRGEPVVEIREIHQAKLFAPAAVA